MTDDFTNRLSLTAHATGHRIWLQDSSHLVIWSLREAMTEHKFPPRAELKQSGPMRQRYGKL